MISILSASPQLRTLNTTPSAPPAGTPPPAGSPQPPDPNKPQPPPPGPPPPLPSGAQPPNQPKPAPPPQPAPPSSNGGFQKPTTVTITRTWDEPILDSTRLGSIPDDYFQWTWGWGWPGGSSTYHPVGNGTDFGPVPVYRDVPEQNPDGTPKMRSTTQTITGTTYNQETRTIVNGLVGAGAGVGAAALTGSLMGASVGPIGMLVGGVLGAAAGASIGLKTASGDQLKEQWNTQDISKPTMTGYTEWLQPSYHYEQDCHYEGHDANGNPIQQCESRQVLDGFWHQFSPEIQWAKLGEYNYPTLEHTAKVGTAGAVGLALGAGALVGVGAALLATVL